VDAKKKTLLAADAPTAVAMHGANHMDQDVSKMMEVAGTKAARRQTVILNEQHFEYELCVSCFVAVEELLMEQDCSPTNKHTHAHLSDG
jgi:hypothetical protein